ncbi:MAG TPA: hypothetical protein VEH06_08100 [Candidatus Bathyarchaeia archaeon]|nr:hypothetical protein [Candidatus Bathyarchaeia archaeon]
MLALEKSRKNIVYESTVAFLVIFILVLAQSLCVNTIFLSHDLLVSTILMTNAQTSNSNASSILFLPFQNHGIYILYPFDWHKEAGVQTEAENLSEIVEFYSPLRNAFLKIIELNSTQPLNVTLPQLLTAAVTRDLHITRDFQIIQAGTNVVLAGKSAYLLVSTGEIFKDLRYQTMEIGTLSGDREYIIIFESLLSDYLTYLPAAKKMIDSFMVLK